VRRVKNGLRKSKTGLTTDVNEIEAAETGDDEPKGLELLMKSVGVKAIEAQLVDMGIEAQSTNGEFSKECFAAQGLVEAYGYKALPRLSKSIQTKLIAMAQ
jgi:hypothetical protein